MNITAVCFTFALPGGLWIEEDHDESKRSWMTFGQLTEKIGEQETNRLRSVACRQTATGMWYNVESRDNVYENGIRVR